MAEATAPTTVDPAVIRYAWDREHGDETASAKRYARIVIEYRLGLRQSLSFDPPSNDLMPYERRHAVRQQVDGVLRGMGFEVKNGRLVQLSPPAVAYTLHPFADEAVWNEDGTEAMEFDSPQAAAAYAADYRKDMRRGVADGTPEGEQRATFYEGMWFTIDGDDASRGLVGPDDTLIGGAESLDLYERISDDGEWPDDALRGMPHLFRYEASLMLVAEDKGEVVERVGALLNEAASLLASHGVEAYPAVLDRVEVDDACYDIDADPYRDAERKAVLKRRPVRDDGGDAAARC